MSEAEERDRDGENEQERFVRIRKYFLAWLEEAGHTRTERYNSPKFGKCEPTEQDVVRSWAKEVRVPVNDILIGIDRAFTGAAERGAVVTSFRYCVPQIVGRLNEMRGSR